jgi:hypothetical protein
MIYQKKRKKEKTTQPWLCKTQTTITTHLQVQVHIDVFHRREGNNQRLSNDGNAV